MRIAERVSHFAHDFGERAVCGFDVCGKHGRLPTNLAGQLDAEVVPGNQIHREVVRAFAMADLVNRSDAAVLELGRGLGFAHKARDTALVQGEVARHHLDGHLAIQTHLSRAKNNPRAATADLFDQGKVAELHTLCGKPHRRRL